MPHCLLTGSWGQTEFMWKKKNLWHVSISVINEQYTGMRVVKEVLKLEEKKKMNRSDDADHEIAETCKC